MAKEPAEVPLQLRHAPLGDALSRRAFAGSRIGNRIYAGYRVEMVPISALGGADAQRSQGTPVKTPGKGNDAGPSGGVLGQLDRPLHRFRTAVSEKETVQPVGQ